MGHRRIAFGVIWGWKYVGSIKNITSYTNSKKRFPLCICFIFNPIFKIYIIIIIKLRDGEWSITR